MITVDHIGAAARIAPPVHATVGLIVCGANLDPATLA